MNHRSSGLSVSDAIGGFLQFKLAEGRSPRTVVGYRHDLREWLIHAGDKDVTLVNAQEIRAFLIYLWTDYKPLRFSSDLLALSPKTIRNYGVSLSALFSWLSREFDLPSPMSMARPTPCSRSAARNPSARQCRARPPPLLAKSRPPRRECRAPARFPPALLPLGWR